MGSYRYGFHMQGIELSDPGIMSQLEQEFFDQLQAPNAPESSKHIFRTFMLACSELQATFPEDSLRSKLTAACALRSEAMAVRQQMRLRACRNPHSCRPEAAREQQEETREDKGHQGHQGC